MSFFGKIQYVWLVKLSYSLCERDLGDWSQIEHFLPGQNLRHCVLLPLHLVSEKGNKKKIFITIKFICTTIKLFGQSHYTFTIILNF